MVFNLIEYAWLPVRRNSGVRVWLRPGDLTTEFPNNPAMALDFPRPDWNAAVTEWLIGLAFLALRPTDIDDWAQSFREPPMPESLQTAFARLAFAFDLDGDGPRAFQDFDPLEDAELKSLSGLLMDAPGENTLRNNADLFIKRGGADSLGLPFAAAALITLQTYAPAGGAGHRTSMRGGGPLSTLVSPRRKGPNGREVQTLWDKVWANTPYAEYDTEAATSDTPPFSAKWASVFPWLAATKVSTNDKIVTPEDATPAQAFFACPRRIRLRFSSDAGACDLGGGDGAVATGMVTLNYGANYLSWTHPLSPYREDKKAGKLPLHPHAGPSDYGDFAAWWGLENEEALTLRLWQDRRKSVRKLIGAEGVEAVGFDMDNMKARQWLEARFPWVPVYDASGQDLAKLLKQIILSSDEAARALRYAVKVALYGQRQAAGGYKLPETLPRDALPEPAEQLWRETDSEFRRQVNALVNGEVGDGLALKQGWLAGLRRAAFHLFDQSVDLDGMTDSSPHRLLVAREGLAKALSPWGPVAKALQVNPPATARTKKEAV